MFSIKKIPIFILYTVFLFCVSKFVQAQSDDIIQSREKKIRAIYGFVKEDSKFRNKSDEEVLQTLKSWHVNRVITRDVNDPLVSKLRKSGIRVYVEVPFFVGEKWWHKYPTSRPVTAAGELLKKEGWYAGVNPTNLNVRN